MSGAESEKEREHLQPYEHRPYLTSSLVMFDSEEEEEEEEDEVPHFLPCLFEEDDRTDLWICDIVSWEDFCDIILREDFCDIILRERLWRHHSLLSPLMGRAVSPASSCVSMKSGRSMRLPLSFKRPESMMSMQSDRPIEIPPPVKLSDPPSMEYVWIREHRPFFHRENLLIRHLLPRLERSPLSSCDSAQSDHSMNYPMAF